MIRTLQAISIIQKGNPMVVAKAGVRKDRKILSYTRKIFPDVS